MNALILHPDISALRDRVEALSHALTEYFDERLHLSFDVLPTLRYRYTSLFGQLEQQVQERTLVMTERRRMVELFALKLDRGQKLDAQMVELVVRAVHAEFGRIRSRVERTVRVGERRRGRSDAGNQSADDSPRQRALQARALYRQLARHLHPDMRGGDDELSRRYWEMVQQANMRCDLPLLRTLLHLVKTVGEVHDLSSQTLEAEQKRLKEAIRHERSIVESLKGEEIYQRRDDLENEEWIAGRHAELEAERAEIEAEIEKCDRFLAPILSLRQSSDPLVVPNILEDFVETMYFNNR